MTTVTEIFVSYQGEGKNIGRKTLFLRYSLCNFRCSFCDTSKDATHSYDSDSDLISDLSIYVDKYDPDLIVITGGEPFLQSESVYSVLNSFYRIEKAVETNGSVQIDYGRIPENVTITIGYKPSYKDMFVTNNIKVPWSNREIKIVFDPKEEEKVLESIRFLKKEDPNCLIWLMPLGTMPSEIMTGTRNIFNFLDKYKDDESEFITEASGRVQYHMRSIRVTTRLHIIAGIR